MKSKKILLVEDNPDDVELTLQAFKKNNLQNEVILLKDGAEALEYLFCTGKYAKRSLEDVPAVVLMDLKLPKVGGLEVLARIRSEERTKLIPVVILTSSKEDRDIIDAYKNGCNSYVRKPVVFKEFSEAVCRLSLYWLLMNEPPKTK